MSKKKTKTIDNEQEVLVKAEPQKLGYEGSIKIAIMRGNTVVETKEVHNAGTKHLFYFLVQCLTGNYTSAEPNRPKYLVLGKSASESVTSKISVDTTPQIVQDSDNYLALLHFTVPRSFITASTGDKIKYLWLYGSYADTSNVLAEVILSEEEALDIDSFSANTTLVIEWSLKIENKTGGTN